MPRNSKKSSDTIEVTSIASPTQNPCSCCAPLGAALVFAGIKNGMTVLHGSQGCATYIRRYLISHFREPIDIASSSFSEDTVVFGGKDNLVTALKNVSTSYHPHFIGVATTCLAETIGEMVQPAVTEFLKVYPESTRPTIVSVSTPSYAMVHSAGYRVAARAVVSALSVNKGFEGIVLVPGIVSPADLRYLREVCKSCGIEVAIIGDYGQTLDGGLWDTYMPLPDGGTPVELLATIGSAALCADWSGGETDDAASLLAERFGMKTMQTVPPIGIEAFDALLDAIMAITGRPMPDDIVIERKRLLDAYVDGHKYLFGVKVAIIADEPLAAGLYHFCREVGMVPVLVGSGGRAQTLARLLAVPSTETTPPLIADDTDYVRLDDALKSLQPNLILGSSKAYRSAKALDIPLVRVGFPIHDRFGGQRTLHLGYRGALELFDRIVNALLERKQSDTELGYSYL